MCATYRRKTKDYNDSYRCIHQYNNGSSRSIRLSSSIATSPIVSIASLAQNSMNQMIF